MANVSSYLSKAIIDQMGPTELDMSLAGFTAQLNKFTSDIDDDKKMIEDQQILLAPFVLATGMQAAAVHARAMLAEAYHHMDNMRETIRLLSIKKHEIEEASKKK